MSAGGKNASPQVRKNGKRPAEGADRHEGPKKGNVEAAETKQNHLGTNRRMVEPTAAGDDSARVRGAQKCIGAIPTATSKQQQLIAREFHENLHEARQGLLQMELLGRQQQNALTDMSRIVNDPQYTQGMYVGCASAHVLVEWNCKMMQNGDGGTPWVWQFTVKGGRQPRLVQLVCSQPSFAHAARMP